MDFGYDMDSLSLSGGTDVPTQEIYSPMVDTSTSLADIGTQDNSVTSWADLMVEGFNDYTTNYMDLADTGVAISGEEADPSSPLSTATSWLKGKLGEVSGNEWAKLIGTAMSGFAASKFKQKELDLKERAQSLSEEKVRRAATSSEKLKVPGLIGAFKAKA